MADVWKKKWEELLAAGKLAGKTWAKKRKIKTENLSEIELQELVRGARGNR